MLGSLLRLGTLAAGSGALSAGLRNVVLKLSLICAAVMTGSLLLVVAVAAFAVAVYLAVVPDFGPVWGAVAVGVLLTIVAGGIALGCRWALRRRRVSLRRPLGAAAGLGEPGGMESIAALGASVQSELHGALTRHAVPVLLTAFVAGMIMNRRR